MHRTATGWSARSLGPGGHGSGEHGPAGTAHSFDAIRACALAAGGGLALAAGLLGLRRLAGALIEPLTASDLALAVGGAIAIQIAARVSWFRFWVQGGSIGRWSKADLAFQALLSVALVAVVLTLSPGSGSGGMAVLWLAALAAEAAGWWLVAPGRRRVNRHRLGDVPPVPGPAPSARVEDDFAQRITRRERPDGGEEIEGRVAAKLQQGQRHAFAHVAFCPPLAGTPDVSVHQVSGPPARIKPGQVLPYGARFDIKLEAAAPETCQVRLEFTATCPRVTAAQPTLPASPPGT